MPKVTLAKTAGFCFGVKRAVDIVYQELEKGNKVCTLGPIIHNDEVVNDMISKGVKVIAEEDIAKENLRGYTVIIRSHGISKEVQDELEASGCNVVDATCPFVKKIHNTVSKYAAEDYDIVIIGSKDHPEVQGILGWCKNKGKALESAEDIEVFEPRNEKKKVCVVAQTTFNQKKFKELVEIISKKGYDIIAVNTICNATAERQNEAQKLASESDAMVVIGGKNSSNTRKLYEICKSQCENTHFIQTLKDLDTELINSDLSLGITAGASTPKNIIQEVLTACQKKEVLENY
ncbi:4-hydroxy-3-methylbut-2-enyl diphosphate reductase [Eubacterium xylanophilum]|uniref:4-hydroxy-3-methylbut-2-enyl diphosphate reductase n=1 Tax=Eubacterium xylanophilum TaxID=39497 RepID=UPI0004AFE7D3|nr:4-hydroxy-3-methylbut-2-enyl diphosphate reductase [Eubacterium xylanophilum]